MISSNDFPFSTDGAGLASGALAVADVGASAVEVEVDAPAPAPKADGAVDVVAPRSPVVGVLAVAVVGFAPNNGAGVVVVVSPAERVALLSPG